MKFPEIDANLAHMALNHSSMFLIPYMEKRGEIDQLL